MGSKKTKKNVADDNKKGTNSKLAASAPPPQKKKTKKLNALEPKPESESVQAPSQKKVGERVFTPEDEITILKGLLDLKNQKQVVIWQNLPALNLSFEPSNSQLAHKVAKLKSKHLKKAKIGGGEPLFSFSNDHERNVYDLCQQIWKEFVVCSPLEIPRSSNGYEDEGNNVTSFQQLFEKLRYYGLCGALSADLESEEKKGELVLRLEAQMYRLSSAREMTASFLAKVRKCQG